MGALSLAVLKESAAVLDAPDLRCNYMTAVLKQMGVKDENKAAQLWAASGLNVQQFVKKNEDLATYIRNNRLSYIQSSGGSSTTRSSNGFNAESFESQLAARLKSESRPAVVEFVESRVSKEDRSNNPVFVRSLTKVVTEGALDGLGGSISNVKLNVDTFTSFCTDILTNLIVGKEAELEALFALQELMHSLEHPNMLLAQLFQHLYDQDVINPDTFTTWRNDTSSKNQQGKGVAVKASIQFFTWLEENENDEDDEEKMAE